MKCFLTGKKVPCIPSVFHQNRFITDFKEKAELFNSSFANQCSSVQNSSVLPTDFELFRDKSFSNIFTDNDVGRIISSLDPNKAHGHDMMSIRMLKICGNSINKSLGLQSLLRAWDFSSKLEKKPLLFLFIKKRQAINREL